MKMSEIEKHYAKMKPCRVKCKNCGHTNTIQANKDFKICSFCNMKLRNNTKARFEYMLRKTIKEMNKSE